MPHAHERIAVSAALLLLAFVLVAVPSAAAEGPDEAGSVPATASAPHRLLPTFASTVDMVNLSVSVTDTHDRHIAGLAAEDFRVIEDGVPQQLSLFSRERLPLSLAVLVDSSMSMERDLPAVKAAARRLLSALGPKDEAEIVEFNERFSVRQDFSADQDLLGKAVDAIEASGSTGVYNALYFTLKDPRFRHKGDALRRQAIVILTDGEDTSSLVTDDQVLDIVKKASVTIYTISIRRPEPVPTKLVDVDSRAVHFLTACARETGGRSYFPAAISELEGVYDRIADELRTQYALGYVSSNPVRDGKWRKVAIEMARGSALLRYRLGYFAVPGARSRLAAAANRAGSASPVDR